MATKSRSKKTTRDLILARLYALPYPVREWLNHWQELGLISDNCVKLDDVADCDLLKVMQHYGV
jgi:hypothetical protein